MKTFEEWMKDEPFPHPAVGTEDENRFPEFTLGAVRDAYETAQRTTLHHAAQRARDKADRAGSAEEARAFRLFAKELEGEADA